MVRPIVNESCGPRTDERSRTFPGTTDTVIRARTMIAGWLDAAGASTDLCERAALVVSELASNAVQASPDRPYTVRIASGRHPATTTVSVESEGDRSDLPEPGTWGPTTPLSPRGRGLGIVHHLARSVSVTEPVAGRITITVELTEIEKA